MPKGHILIVDDTPANIAVLEAWLSVHGYTVTTADNGPLALTLALQKPPDLVLLDILMPKMDGYEVCERMKASDETREIPIIFVSAIDTSLDIVRAFRAGGVDYINKPFHVEELLARVETQIRLHQQQHELDALRASENARLENLNRLKDQFVNTVSHDLKNPIGVILGSVVLLKEMDNLAGDTEAQFMLNMIDQHGQFMLNLVSSLLDLTRIEAGMGLTPEAVSFCDTLRQISDGFTIQAERKDIDLLVTPPMVDCDIFIDRTQFYQVISNLLGNAIKYTPAGGCVEIAGHIEDQQVVIEVVDNGLGIPEEDIPHLFEKFYRVARKEHQAEKGSGLGLSIARAIIEQHNGHIAVESKLGAGSRFTIFLPRPEYLS